MQYNVTVKNTKLDHHENMIKKINKFQKYSKKIIFENPYIGSWDKFQGDICKRKIFCGIGLEIFGNHNRQIIFYRQDKKMVYGHCPTMTKLQYPLQCTFQNS